MNTTAKTITLSDLCIEATKEGKSRILIDNGMLVVNKDNKPAEFTPAESTGEFNEDGYEYKGQYMGFPIYIKEYPMLMQGEPTKENMELAMDRVNSRTYVMV